MTKTWRPEGEKTSLFLAAMNTRGLRGARCGDGAGGATHFLRVFWLALTTIGGVGCGGAASLAAVSAEDGSVEPPVTERETRGVRFFPVTVTSRDGSVTVDAELAVTARERQRGLMFRRYLAPRGAMLFVFDAEQRQEFWMANTFLSLDVLFIDSAGAVVGVVERAEPLSRDPIAVDAPSRYVLEVRSGFARSHGLGVGARVDLSALPPELRPETRSAEAP